jgi:hypothetical protein
MFTALLVCNHATYASTKFKVRDYIQVGIAFNTFSLGDMFEVISVENNVYQLKDKTGHEVSVNMEYESNFFQTKMMYSDYMNAFFQTKIKTMVLTEKNCDAQYNKNKDILKYDITGTRKERTEYEFYMNVRGIQTKIPNEMCKKISEELDTAQTKNDSYEFLGIGGMKFICGQYIDFFGKSKSYRCGTEYSADFLPAIKFEYSNNDRNVMQVPSFYPPLTTVNAGTHLSFLQCIFEHSSTKTMKLKDASATKYLFSLCGGLSFYQTYGFGKDLDKQMKQIWVMKNRQYFKSTMEAINSFKDLGDCKKYMTSIFLGLDIQEQLEFA